MYVCFRSVCIVCIIYLNSILFLECGYFQGGFLSCPLERHLGTGNVGTGPLAGDVAIEVMRLIKVVLEAQLIFQVVLIG